MATMELGVVGITLTFNEDDLSGASITSDMKEVETSENAAFNAGVDGLESLVLAHFCAGTDICSPDYKEGIETAYAALCNHH